MKMIDKDRVLRLNCPGFGEETHLNLGRAKTLDNYQVIIANPVSLLHLFDKGPEPTRRINQLLSEGANQLNVPDDALIQELINESDARLEELIPFLSQGGLLIYFLCRPFVLAGPSISVDNYDWLSVYAPATKNPPENGSRQMSALSHGRVIEPTEEGEQSEMAEYLHQDGVEWNTIIRTDFLSSNYSVMATAGSKKCIAAQFWAGDNGGKVVFLPAPYSPDFDRVLMACVDKWYQEALRQGTIQESTAVAAGAPVEDPAVRKPGGPDFYNGQQLETPATLNPAAQTAAPAAPVTYAPPPLSSLLKFPGEEEAPAEQKAQPPKGALKSLLSSDLLDDDDEFTSALPPLPTVSTSTSSSSPSAQAAAEPAEAAPPAVKISAQDILASVAQEVNRKSPAEGLAKAISMASHLDDPVDAEKPKLVEPETAQVSNFELKKATAEMDLSQFAQTARQLVEQANVIESVTRDPAREAAKAANPAPPSVPVPPSAAKQRIADLLKGLEFGKDDLDNDDLEVASPAPAARAGEDLVDVEAKNPPAEKSSTLAGDFKPNRESVSRNWLGGGNQAGADGPVDVTPLNKGTAPSTPASGNPTPSISAMSNEEFRSTFEFLHEPEPSAADDPLTRAKMQEFDLPEEKKSLMAQAGLSADSLMNELSVMNELNMLMQESAASANPPADKEEPPVQSLIKEETNEEAKQNTTGDQVAENSDTEREKSLRALMDSLAQSNSETTMPASEPALEVTANNDQVKEPAAAAPAATPQSSLSDLMNAAARFDETKTAESVPSLKLAYQDIALPEVHAKNNQQSGADAEDEFLSNAPSFASSAPQPAAAAAPATPASPSPFAPPLNAGLSAAQTSPDPGELAAAFAAASAAAEEAALKEDIAAAKAEEAARAHQSAWAMRGPEPAPEPDLSFLQTASSSDLQSLPAASAAEIHAPSAPAPAFATAASSEAPAPAAQTTVNQGWAASAESTMSPATPNLAWMSASPTTSGANAPTPAQQVPGTFSTPAAASNTPTPAEISSAWSAPAAPAPTPATPSAPAADLSGFPASSTPAPAYQHPAHPVPHPPVPPSSSTPSFNSPAAASSNSFDSVSSPSFSSSSSSSFSSFSSPSSAAGGGASDSMSPFDEISTTSAPAVSQPASAAAEQSSPALTNPASAFAAASNSSPSTPPFAPTPAPDTSPAPAASAASTPASIPAATQTPAASFESPAANASPAATSAFDLAPAASAASHQTAISSEASAEFPAAAAPQAAADATAAVSPFLETPSALPSPPAPSSPPVPSVTSPGSTANHFNAPAPVPPPTSQLPSSLAELNLSALAPPIPASEMPASAQQVQAQMTAPATTNGDGDKSSIHALSSRESSSGASIEPNTNSSTTPQPEELIRKMQQLTTTPAPSWCADFSFPFIDQLRKEQAQLAEQMRQLQSAMNGMEARLETVETLKVALLTGEQEAFLSASQEILTRVGWQVQASRNDANELWLVRGERVEAIARVVRSANGTNRSDLAQLAQSVIAFWDKYETEPKGLLLAQNFAHQHPGERTEPDFAAPLIDAAAKKSLCLMSSFQLLAMFKDGEMGQMTADEMRKRILETNGKLAGFVLDNSVAQPATV